MENTIQEHLVQVRQQLAAACQEAGRSPDEVTLVGVSKTQPAEAVLAVYQAGLRDFGENRPEEAAGKIEQVNAAVAGESPRWHMVGHVQRRKADSVVRCFDVVHSVDSVRLALRLEEKAAALGSVLPILIEVNVGGEASKYGFREGEGGALVQAVAEIAALAHLRVEGLMTVAPIADEPEAVRPVFARLRTLRDELRTRFPEVRWAHLSMGMTDDFEVAVEEGATMVRVGRAIFGPRR